MTYDFYMFAATPVEIRQKYSKLLEAFDIEEQAAQQLALFRDPKAVEAIATASDDVRNCFLDAGFGLTSYDRGIRGGGFPAEDTEARAVVMAQLRENLAALPADADWNGFDIDAFLAAADAAEPVKRERKTFAKVRRAFSPRITLTEELNNPGRVLSRPLSTPAPGF